MRDERRGGWTGDLPTRDDVIAPLEESLQPVPILNVNVDFNDLLQTTSEEKAYEIVGKLKDLLQ